MNVTTQQAEKMLCPLMTRASSGIVKCAGSACLLWQWDEPMTEGPDSYISDPPPTGHCGLATGATP